MRRHALCFIAIMVLTVTAQNPVVQTWFTTDPAPLSYGDKMYLYVGHDEDRANFFWMYEWRIYSSSDMVNWTDHGTQLSLSSFSWADDRAWAAQAIERNGHFYWYVCAHSKIGGGMAIGVAVSESPTGPFRDAIGKPLFDNGSWDNIDPTVFIDDDGQAWIYWGNPRVYYAKLNNDMISIAGEVKTLDMTEESFGGPVMNQREKDRQYKDSYVEGPWIMKKTIPSNMKSKKKTSLAHRKGIGGEALYYLLYAAGGVPEHISYSTAPTPEGPWTYRGPIMPLEDTKSFTNHCGIAEYKGHNYFFYHTGKLPGGGGFGRSVAIEEFQFNKDGSFPIIHHTDEGVSPIGALNPYQRTEAETIAWSTGVKTENNQKTGVYVSEIHNGDYIKVREVDFGTKHPTSFMVSAASALQGGHIEVHLDSLSGRQIAIAKIPYTGGWEEWQEVSTTVAHEVSGKHDVYFCFTGYKGMKLFNFDWWKFKN